MTINMNTQQELQDGEYWFPYHYVSTYGGQFRHSFVDTWAINYVSTIEFLLGKLGEQRSSRIVDIGCGDGRFSSELSRAFPQATVVGVDYSKRAVALATAMNPGIANLQFLSLDITNDTGLQPFDVAILMEVFEHIPLADAERFMSGVHSMLKPGGELLLTVPHENKPLEYKHYQHFSIAGISKYLQREFRIVEVIPFERRHFARRLMSALLSNRLFTLNSGRLLNAIYGWYKTSLFRCASEAECQRVFVRAVAK